MGSGGGGNPLSRGLSGLATGGPIGAISNIFGGEAVDAEANAVRNAAMEQQAFARQAQQQIMDESARYEKALMALAQATPAELRAQEQALAMTDKQLQADERLLASIDPALMEASQKALSLLREGYQGPGAQGRQTQQLYAPFEQSKQAERQKLINSLQQQYGPGAETSSIGLKALREFDLAAATQSAQFGMQQEQQSYERGYGQFRDMFTGATGLSQLLGNQRSGINLQGTAANALGIAGAFQNRQLQARQAAGQVGISALAGTQPAVINSAGAQYMGDLTRTRNERANWEEAKQTQKDRDKAVRGFFTQWAKGRSGGGDES